MAAVKGVTVYANRDYDGNSVTLAKGKYGYHEIADQLKINDTISSIKIPPGYTVTVWEHNFSGKTTTFKADTPYVADQYDDMISSIIVDCDEIIAAESSSPFFGKYQQAGGWGKDYAETRFVSWIDSEHTQANFTFWAKNIRLSEGTFNLLTKKGKLNIEKRQIVDFTFDPSTEYIYWAYGGGHVHRQH
jgi:hypothetical protein